MEAQIGSPNWGWAQLGYTIERSGRTGSIRTIKDKDGNVVLHHVGHEEEIAWLKARGVIQDDIQPELF